MTNQSISFVGNLTRDPELRTVESKNGPASVVSFAVAVNGAKPEDTVFFECDAWRFNADFIFKWFKKGSPIAVNDAEARTDSWTDKTSGEKRSRMKFTVNRCSFVPKPPNGHSSGEAEAPEDNERNAEAPDAGVKDSQKEAPETPRRSSTNATPRPRATRKPVAVAVEDDDSDIPF